MISGLRFDISEDGHLLAFGLDAMPPDRAAALRADIKQHRDDIIADVQKIKTRLAENVRQYADNTLTDAQRDALGREGDQLIKYLPELTVKRIFEEN